MSMRDAVTGLLRGGRDSALLHNVRFQAFGAEHYGEEAVREQFRAQPHDLSDGARWVEGPGQVAVFDDRTALIADVGEGGLMRLWRLGGGTLVEPEPRIDVAFDPDLSQARGDIFFRAEDHPGLPVELVPGIEAAARQAVDVVDHGEASPYRARAFVLRAFGHGTTGAALLAVHRIGADRVRTAGFAFVAVLLRDSRITLVRDTLGEQAIAASRWRSRF